MPQNPFSYAYDLIFKALTNFAPLTDEVPILDIRNLDDPKFRPQPNRTQSADRPEILVTERRIIGKIFSQNSQGVFLQCLYPIEIKGGNYAVDRVNLNTILVMQALANTNERLGDSGPPANIIDKWDWVDSSVVAKDAVPGGKSQPMWVCMGGVLVYFSMRRSDFIHAQFT